LLKESVMLRKPVLAKCGNRRQAAKINPLAGEPQEWLNTPVLKQRQFRVLSFDFFVNWPLFSIADEIWNKRLVREEVSPWPVLDPQILMNWIEQVDSPETVQVFQNFCRAQRFNAHYFLFKDATRWEADLQVVVDVEIGVSTQSPLLTKPSELRQRIRKLRGDRVPLGAGGLIYSTSSLECFLSKTTDFWPGDADAVLVDEKNLARAILEFKKHNLDTPIEKQTLLNYRDRDKLKYQSLGLLRDRLQTAATLPILMVYYPTQAHIKKVKIERLAGPFDALQVVEARISELPRRSAPDSFHRFSEEVLKLAAISPA
jgi:hypothetical protein